MQISFFFIIFAAVFDSRTLRAYKFDTMLDSFFKIHDFLVEHAHNPIRRLLMDQINWDDRLICIKGGRGIGKTDFLLARARDIEKAYADDIASRSSVAQRGKTIEQKRPCLYINFNDLYFTEHSLVDFAGEFVKEGGQTLLIDNVFKTPDWSKQLRRTYDKYRTLHIVFSASPVMPIDEDNKDMALACHMYNLRGFSFREYLNLQTGHNFRPYTIDEILHNHGSISREICEYIHPLDYFRDYLDHGYYPSYLENTNFDDALLKTINNMLEVDVLMIKQIDVSCLPKLRKLLYVMLRQTPCTLNISNLSDMIGLSRATTMNYIKALKDARLLNMFYLEGKAFPQKPVKIYTQNTNIIHLIHNHEVTEQELFETYFYNVMHACHRVNATERNAMFVIDGKTYFDVRVKAAERDSIRPCATGNLEIGRGNYIPLWLLGFLY